MTGMDNTIDNQGNSDILLLGRLRGNDGQAFQLIYNKYSDLMFDHAYRVLRDRDVCMDIVQEIFAWIWSNKEVLEINSLKPYLMGAVKFKVANFIRKGKIEESYIKNFQEIRSSVSVIEQNIEFKELKALIEDHIKLLPAKCRQVFEMSRKEYLTNKEIALKMGISEKTVEMHISLAMRRLRAVMARNLHLLLIFF